MEKVFYTVLIIATLTIVIGLLYIKTKTQEVEGRTVSLTTQINQLQTKNTEYNQQITDLGSGQQISDIATKDGMSQNFSNVLKATK